MKIAILTNFMEFNPGYSLTGIVQDQIRMLCSHGHEVHLFVNDQFHGKGNFTALPEGDAEKYGLNEDNYQIRKLIPFSHLKDYKSISELTDDHKKTIADTKAVLIKELKDFDLAFTHDFIFQGWFMPYGLACKEATPHLPTTRWMHWIHSVPSTAYDWWRIRDYGPRHKIIFPNITARQQVVEQFAGWPEDMRCIHHIKDPRSWFGFDKETCDFIKKYPAVMQSTYVKIYPASVDRLAAKRLQYVISIMANIKKKAHTVCLVVANQWATTRQHKQNVEKYKQAARREGLVPGEDLIFTSDLGKEYEAGVPQYMIRNLMLLSNLFIFPTKEESFGLVLPEAALSGVLTVSNKSLGTLIEVAGNEGLFFEFGSHHMAFHNENMVRYLNDLALIILGRFRENEALRIKTFSRQKYNWDTLYNHEYLPVMAESKTWGL